MAITINITLHRRSYDLSHGIKLCAGVFSGNVAFLSFEMIVCKGLTFHSCLAFKRTHTSSATEPTVADVVCSLFWLRLTDRAVAEPLGALGKTPTTHVYFFFNPAFMKCRKAFTMGVQEF